MSELLAEAATLLTPLPPAARAAFDAAHAQYTSGAWTVMAVGLRSVGKSSFVCALWSDPELLPTAVRDCTQSNTVVRVPAANETDRSLVLHYLSRERAQEFATRGLAFYRIAQMLDETLGPTGPRLDQGPPAEKLQSAIAAVTALFAKRRDLAVLHEPLTEPLEQLEEFLTFLDSPAYQPSAAVPAAWTRRQEFLMGLRRADGRSVGLGPLLALQSVDVLRASPDWPVPPPRLVDTPWVPKFHNARRAELVLEQAAAADVVVVLALPELFEPEEWLQGVLEKDPLFGARTLVVFNQIDTIDPLSLYRREGFAEAFAGNMARLERLGVPAENLCISCARLPFLQASEPTAEVVDRLRRLEKVLGDVRKAAGSRSDSPVQPRLLEAVDTPDGGIGALRNRLAQMYRERVLPARLRETVRALTAVNTSALPPEARARLSAIHLLLHRAAHIPGGSR